MKYYPNINKEKPKKINYTPGGMYMFMNGDEYIGYYFNLNNDIYSGTEFNDKSKLLYPYNSDKNFIKYSVLKNRIYLSKYILPRETLPVIDNEDIENGYLTRYFIRQRNDNNADILEINEQQYNSWQMPGRGINENFYVAIEIQWKITGKLNSYSEYGRIIEGIYDFNKRIVAEQVTIDLTKKITSYTEYANPD